MRIITWILTHTENLMTFDMSFDPANGGLPGMDVDVVTKIEHVQNSEEPRFRFEVEKEKIQALTESQKNRNTKKYRWSYNIFES